MKKIIKFKKKYISKNETVYKLFQNDERVSFEYFLILLTTKPAFRKLFNAVLSKSPFDAFFFECPGVNNKTVKTTLFEFVLINSKQLANIKVNSDPFEMYLNKCKKSATYFKNLSKTTELIIPCRLYKNTQQYAHLANFCRMGETRQQNMFWKLVGTKMLELLKSKTCIWLSTSGLGVHWLHIRLDQKPKYYNYVKYKKLIC